MSSTTGGLFQRSRGQQEIIVGNLSTGSGDKLSANHGQDNIVRFGHCCCQHFIIRGTIGEDDVKADYLGSGLAQVIDSQGMETAWPLCPPTIGFKGIVIDTSDSDIRRRGFGGEKLVRKPQTDAIEWLNE